MSSRKIEMHWRCSACANTNLGRFKECQKCGDPKDAGERFEMPSDTRAAATVTDPGLLRRANAGSDWRCRYCSSDQSRADGSCAQCGASQGEGTDVRAVQAVARPAGAIRRSKALLAVPVVASLVAIGIVLTIVILSGPTTASVASTEWQREVAIERYRVVAHEGFVEQRPQGAFDVRSLGRRHHHDEQVLDHMATEAYQEREQQGYETERYTEQVSCGQDCRTEPEHCSEHCTSDENGFASCHTTCSGGGQSCSTRYCSESRTRQVPHYVMVRKTREVPVYRSEPRDAEAFAWNAWEWTPDRVVTAHGVGDAPRWPSDEEIARGATLGEGERERATRSERYSVRMREEEGREHVIVVPDEASFVRYAIGDRYELEVRSDTARVLRRLGAGE